MAQPDAVTSAERPAAQVFFGGPERPGRLRDLLEERVDAVPAGGEIVWVTYYFRDERLADALVRAHRRGVRVRLAVDGAPRLKSANDAVIRRLEDSAEGLGPGLRVVRLRPFRHLHEKLYCFSHPRPVALVGSFNPSGNVPDDERVIRAIGDQDRGHNCLVELSGPEVAPLMAHARRVHGRRWAPLQRFGRSFDPPIGTKTLRAYLFPRLRNPLDGLLDGLAAGTRLRVAASHLSDGRIAAALTRLAEAGVDVELLTEATQRRVPEWIEKQILAGGVSFERYRHPDGLPMHNKFLLAEGPAGRWAAFGSLNLTAKSRWLNQEILVVSEDEGLFDAFAQRWDEMKAELAARENRPGTRPAADA